ncbi:hypothetical protein BOX15_Mlig020601g1 [Macrostomum lignano]|uniref:VWFA domain-containing protein n=1 Tax=Macrostomum lignano TaxID=282301 RepID=A0A267GQN4_9PLAT|nr:hypothetical protein BOX15_Mlig020601g1 [Macrostomum lignano]
MALPGAQPLDLAFSFDTTGSMGSVINEVRSNIAEMLQRLATDIPDLSVALIAHGDYGDRYETEIRDFGTSTADLVRFAKTVQGTHGGDEPECYELVLQQARTRLSWRPHSSRALVLVGDAFPHEVGSARNKYKIDWKAETELLHQLGVTVYCVQCGSSRNSQSFMDHVAKVTGGLRLPLAEFRGVRDFLMAIAYREGGTDILRDGYEREVRARDGAALAGDVSAMLGLVRRSSAATLAASSVAADPSGAATGTKTAARRTKTAKAVTAGTSGKAKPVTKPFTKPVKKPVTKLVTKPVTKPVTKTVTKSIMAAARISRARAARAVRTRRETCSDRHLPAGLAALTWSPWRLVGQPGSVSRLSWQRFGSGSVRKSLFSRGGGGGQQVVELAVQPRPGARRFPLFGRVLSAGSSRRRGLPVVSVKSLLAGRPAVRAQLERVLRQGMRVFARVAGASPRACGPGWPRRRATRGTAAARRGAAASSCPCPRGVCAAERASDSCCFVIVVDF